MTDVRQAESRSIQEPHAKREAGGASVPVLLLTLWLPGLVVAGGLGTGAAAGVGTAAGVSTAAGVGAGALTATPAGGPGMVGGAARVGSERRGDHRIELRRQTLELHRSWRDAPAAGLGPAAPVMRGSMAAPASAAGTVRPVVGGEALDASRTTPVHPLNEPQDGDPSAARLTESERDLLRRQLRQRVRTLD